MRTVVFNNGKELKITSETAKIIHRRILEGCNKFQCFECESELYLIINLDHVSFIK